MSTVEIRLIRGGEWLAIRAPYDAKWVEMVKRSIPHTQREWDEDEKEWRIVADSLYRASVLRASRHVGMTVKLIDGDITEIIRPDGSRERVTQGNLFGS